MPSTGRHPAPSKPSAWRRSLAALGQIPAKVWLRAAILALLLLSGIVLLRFTPVGDLLTRDRMIALFEQLQSSPYSPLVLMLLYAPVSTLGLPASPLVAGGAVVFGPFHGSIYNLLGLLLGAMTAYYVGRGLGRDFVTRLAGPRLRRAERIFERRGFWPLIQTRFLPIPFAMVSFGAALAGVKAPRFLLTSAIGLTPMTVVHTYFIATLFRTPSKSLGALYLTTWGFLAVVTGWPTLRQGWRRRQRYRELVEKRRARIAEG